MTWRPKIGKPADGSIEISEIREILLSFDDAMDGWDGPGSVSPKSNTVQNAIDFLNIWPLQMGVPDPELYFDGTVALELYGEGGFTRGGFEFIDENTAAFAALNHSDVLASGTFNPKSEDEAIESIVKFRNALTSGKIDAG